MQYAYAKGKVCIVCIETGDTIGMYESTNLLCWMYEEWSTNDGLGKEHKYMGKIVDTNPLKSLK